MGVWGCNRACEVRFVIGSKFVIYKLIKMHPVLVGTILWLIVGLIVGWKVLKHVAASSPPGKEWENQKYTITDAGSAWSP